MNCGECAAKQNISNISTKQTCVPCSNIVWNRKNFSKTVRRSKVTPGVRQLSYGSFTDAF